MTKGRYEMTMNKLPSEQGLYWVRLQYEQVEKHVVEVIDATEFGFVFIEPYSRDLLPLSFFNGDGATHGSLIKVIEWGPHVICPWTD